MALLAAGRKARKASSPASRPHRVGPGRPQHGQGPEGQHQPRRHPEQPLGPVPGGEGGHRRGRPALDQPRPGPMAAHRRRGVPGRRGAPGGRPHGGGEGRHEGGGQQRVARRVGEGLDRGGHPQVAVGQGRRDGGQGCGVPSGRGSGSGGHDADIAGGGGRQQDQGDDPPARRPPAGPRSGRPGTVHVRPPRGQPHRSPPRLGSDGSPYRRGGHRNGAVCKASGRGGAVHTTAHRPGAATRHP